MMFLRNALSGVLLLAASSMTAAFHQGSLLHPAREITTSMAATEDNNNDSEDISNRRSFISKGAMGATAALFATSSLTPASAQVYFDPAIYGDQELRGSAVQSLKEAVRRAILQAPQLAPSFYQLALLDGLSFDASTKDFGPDGRVVTAVLSSKDDTPYMKNLKMASNTLIEACTKLKRMTSIGIADAVALGGVAAIESIGGPSLSVQLGRLEIDKAQRNKLSPLNLMILSGTTPLDDVTRAFRRSGLTEREMTALLGTMLTINTVQKSRSSEDWKQTMKPKFREPGKMGRASDFKRLSDEDIAALEQESTVEGDDGWYIAESFGTRTEQFGAKIGNGQIGERTFNLYLKDLYAKGNNKKPNANKVQAVRDEFGWIGEILTDKNNPTAEAWLSKYAGSYLNYNKDLLVAYNAVTQLGSEYTGGKYEALLKDRKRKTLNDDDMGFSFR